MAGGRVAAVYCAVFLGFGIAVPAADAPSDVQAITLEAMSEDVEVASDGSFINTAHSEYRAVNEAGAMQASRISVLFDSETQQVEILEAHTLKRDGSKIPVDVATIYEQLPSDNTLAVTSFRVKVLLFPQFSAGDTAVYTVRTTSSKPNFPGAFQFGKFFPRGIAYNGARVSVTAPKSMHMRVETHDVAFRKEERGDTIVYTWQRTAPAAKTPTQALVSPLDREPRFFISSFKDYADLGRAYAAQSEPKTAVTAKIQSLANEITAGTSGRREQAQLIFDWVVKHIRYVAIELGRGSFVPHDADAVIAKGYGDCKDHDVLLQALLKAKGIGAESVLINASNAYTLTEAPSFAQLGHVITFLPEFGVYLDSSLQTATFGVLPLVEYGKPAVRASLKSAGVVTIPMPKPGAATVHQTTVQKLAADGTLSGTTTTTATGPYAMELRAIGLLVQSLGAEKAGQLQMASRGFKDGTGKLIVDPLTATNDSYKIHGEFSAKGWEDVLKGDGTIMPGGLRVMSMTGDDMMGPLYGSDEISSEATVCTTAKADEDISLELPAGHSFRITPKDTKIVTPNLTFVAHWTLTGNTLTVHREFSSTVTEPVCSGAVRKQTADALKRIAKSYDANFTVDTAGQATAHPTQDEADVLVERGIAADKAGDHDKAIAAFDAAIALKPDSARAYLNRAYAYHWLKKTEKALEDYTKSMTLDATNVSAYSNRGRVYAAVGRNALALADFDKALSLDPGNAEILIDRARLRFVMGDRGKARADVDAALTAQPDFAPAFAARCQFHMLAGQWQAALTDCNNAVKHDPENAEARMSRANIYQMRRQNDLYLKDIDAVLAKDSSNASARASRAYYYSSQNLNARAIADYDVVLAAVPDNVTLLLARGAIHRTMKHFDLALTDFERALKNQPEDGFANGNRLATLAAMNKTDEAQRECQRLITEHPGKGWPYIACSVLKRHLGDDKGANQDIAKATKLDPNLIKSGHTADGN